MRTVTFIGLMMIAGALRNLAEMGKPDDPSSLAIILIFCVIMDIAEFIKKITYN